MTPERRDSFPPERLLEEEPLTIALNGKRH